MVLANYVCLESKLLHRWTCMHAYFGKTTGCDWDANYCSVWYSTSDMLHVYLLKYAKYSHIGYASAVVVFFLLLLLLLLLAVA